MSNPVEFPGQNFIYRCGPIPNCQPLPCFVSWGSQSPSVTSCWQLSPEELAAVVASGGLIFVRTSGEVPPPVLVAGLPPYTAAEMQTAAVHGPPSLTMEQALALDEADRQRYTQTPPTVQSAFNPQVIAQAVDKLGRQLIDAIDDDQAGSKGGPRNPADGPYPQQFVEILGYAALAYFTAWPELHNPEIIAQMIANGGEDPNFDREGGDVLLDAISQYVNRPDAPDTEAPAAAVNQPAQAEDYQFLVLDRISRRAKDLGVVSVLPDGSSIGPLAAAVGQAVYKAVLGNRDLGGNWLIDELIRGAFTDDSDRPFLNSAQTAVLGFITTVYGRTLDRDQDAADTEAADAIQERGDLGAKPEPAGNFTDSLGTVWNVTTQSDGETTSFGISTDTSFAEPKAPALSSQHNDDQALVPLPDAIVAAPPAEVKRISRLLTILNETRAGNFEPLKEIGTQHVDTSVHGIDDGLIVSYHGQTLTLENWAAVEAHIVEAFNYYDPADTRAGEAPASLLDLALADAKVGEYERLKDFGFITRLKRRKNVLTHKGAVVDTSNWAAFEAQIRQAAKDVGKL